MGRTGTWWLEMAIVSACNVDHGAQRYDCLIQNGTVEQLKEETIVLSV